MAGEAVSFNVTNMEAVSSTVKNPDSSKNTSESSFKDVIKNETQNNNKKTDDAMNSTDNNDKINQSDVNDKVEDNTKEQHESLNINEGMVDMAQVQMLYGSFLINNKDLTVDLSSKGTDSLQLNDFSKNNINNAEISIKDYTNMASTIDNSIENTGLIKLQLNNLEANNNSEFSKLQSAFQKLVSNQNAENAVVNTNENDMQKMPKFDIKQESVLNNELFKFKTNLASENQLDFTSEKHKGAQEDLNLYQGLQTVQKTPVGEVIQFKVADTVPLNSQQAIENLADKIIMKNSNEFDLQLEPHDLGKIHIKLLCENGETKVSILCTTQKALEALSGNSENLATLLENRTGNTTFVQVQREDEHAYNQDYQQQNGHQNNNPENDKKNNQNKNENKNDFFEQLYSGLV